jgi:transposase InsO family protein
VIGGAAANPLCGDGGCFVISAARLKSLGHRVDLRVHRLHLLFEPAHLVLNPSRSHSRNQRHADEDSCAIRPIHHASAGKPWRTTTPDPEGRRKPDLVERDFTAERPNELWVADFTHLRTWEGVVFFSFVIDDDVLGSLGSTGDAYDNALAESFVDSFKTEPIAERP